MPKPPCEHNCITYPCKHLKEEWSKQIDEYVKTKYTPGSIATSGTIDASNITITKLCGHCVHKEHKYECEDITGYDHLNGDHVCGCTHGTDMHSEASMCEYGCTIDPCKHGGTITYTDPYETKFMALYASMFPDSPLPPVQPKPVSVVWNPEKIAWDAICATCGYLSSAFNKIEARKMTYQHRCLDTPPTAEDEQWDS